MTSVFSAEGKNIPCTVIEAGPCVVTQVKTPEKDGYAAVQLAYDEVSEKNTSNPLMGHFKKANTTPKRKLVEFTSFEKELNLGDVVTVEAVDNAWAERLSRNAAITTGGSVFMADYAMTGAQAKKASIPGTSTYCEQIGRAIREAHEQNVDPLPVILDLLGAFELFRGKLDDVARRTEGGFVRGYAHFAGIDDYAGRECELRFQNEHLLAKSGDEVLCSAPDLIAVLDIETALPITTEGMKYGARGVVIGIPVHEHWRSERGLEIAGPRYFGYDIDFVPVEERVVESANEQ